MGKNNNSKTKEASKSSPCEKYELAITNYVIGEKIDIPQKELFEHLAKCRSCQDDLRNWRATYATMRAKEYDSRPEVKQKNQAFIKGLVYGGKKTEKIPIDAERDVKQTARTLYDLLESNGELSVPLMVQKTKLKEYHIQQAIGWLAGTRKIIITRDNETAYAVLRPEMRVAPGDQPRM